MGEAAGREGDTGGGDDSAAGGGLGPADAAARTSLAPGREFDLIRSFLRAARTDSPDVTVEPGDDAAVVRGDGIVLTTDISIEETHFRRDWLSAADVGYRSAIAALSDLAAMGARPIGTLASLALTAEDAAGMAVEIMAGVSEATVSAGGVLLGGDLTSSPGPIILDVVGVGQAAAPILRRGAVPGDEVWVTGTLGGAALAVDMLLRGEAPPGDAMERYRRPIARLREAAWLGERGVPRAMLDVSDGVGGDAGHLAAASGVAIVLESARLPVHEAVARSVEPGLALRLALSGGEDYELCFAAAAGTVEPLRARFVRELGCPLTRIGFVERGEGVYVIGADGARTGLVEGGFQHFRAP